MSSLREADEWELIGRARKALGRAATLPLGSTARAVQWTAYETLKAELDRRAVAVIRELRATPGAGDDDRE